ncbi:energy-coupling factor transporter transmembrane protein EcfT [Rhodococcus sp. HNM0569]|nr:energy-coupling factor transporter transmembrane protein EcfT [Rhodococcus sp. HNM0569]
MPAGVKVAALIAAIVTISVFVRAPWQLVPAAAVVAAAFACAKVPAGVAARQLRPVLWMILVVFVFQLVFTGWARAVVVCGVLLLAVAGAALVTLTTRVSDMLDAVVGVLAPLRRVGVDPERVGLVLAMTIRAVPLLTTVVTRVRDARRARGLGFSLRAFVVPVVVGTLVTADHMGDALAARGVDD